tara:strand:- start:485 stop:667 length:183 start_codon:yes stop_codon:yes gene_type:complete
MLNGTMLTNELLNKEEGSVISVGGIDWKAPWTLCQNLSLSMRSPIVYIFFLKIQVGSYLN